MDDRGERMKWRVRVVRKVSVTRVRYRRVNDFGRRLRKCRRRLAKETGDEGEEEKEEERDVDERERGRVSADKDGTEKPKG